MKDYYKIILNNWFLAEIWVIWFVILCKRILYWYEYVFKFILLTYYQSSSKKTSNNFTGFWSYILSDTIFQFVKNINSLILPKNVNQTTSLRLNYSQSQR